jgi:hypothetical protein
MKFQEAKDINKNIRRQMSRTCEKCGKSLPIIRVYDKYCSLKCKKEDEIVTKHNIKH